MKNPFHLDRAVYKTVDGQELEADVQVPFASATVPFGTKLPVGTMPFPFEPSAFVFLTRAF